MLPNLDNLIEIFTRMRANGFDTSKPLLWGFYFISPKKELLDDVFNELREYGYKIESLEKSDNKDWQLQVTKADVLTPDKLHRRNIAFNELADYCNVEYDGWDVERI